MARVASTSSAVGLPSFRPSAPQSHHQPPRFVNFSFHFQKKNLAHHSLSCRNASNPVDSASKEENPLSEPDSDVNGTAVNAAAGTTETSSFVGGVFPEYPDKTFKRRVALVSTVAGVGFFLSARLNFGGVSLKDLSADALPYEEALSNGKPTVVEFYADWCGICRELAPDVYKAEQQYKDRVNFVMLNVDNTKWKQELDEFGVKGIPHFSFLDKDGNEEGNVVGRLPTQYLLENVDALARGKATVPHARVVEQYSRAQSRKVRSVVDPRSHE